MNNDKYNIDTAILYRKKGTHYADSNIEPGLQSANLVSDDTNVKKTRCWNHLHFSPIRGVV